MNNSGKTTRSAPAAAARARLTFSALPEMSPTVELSCAIVIASLSVGRVLMANLYRFAGPPSNGQACRSAPKSRYLKADTGGLHPAPASRMVVARTIARPSEVQRRHHSTAPYPLA